MNKARIKLIMWSAVLLFILANTNYYWEPWLDEFAAIVDLFLFLVFLVLSLIGLWQLSLVFEERFQNRPRVILAGVLAGSLALSYFRPFDLEKLEGKDVLVAWREGAANCTTTLKENNRFVERNICLGLAITEGSYEIKGDTIFFKNIKTSSRQPEYYEFATITPVSKKNPWGLIRYKNSADTVGHGLWVIKNELKE